MFHNSSLKPLSYGTLFAADLEPVPKLFFLRRIGTGSTIAND